MSKQATLRVVLAGAVVLVVAWGVSGAADKTTGLQQLPAQPATTQPVTTQPAVRAVDPDIMRSKLFSGLIGSKHDFTGSGRVGRDLCLPCHVPHVRDATPPRYDQRPDRVLPMQPYRALGNELNGWSLLCLGCHDGVTATDVYSSGHAIRVADDRSGGLANVRGLRSHPVGVRYPEQAEDYHSRAAVEAAGLLLPDGRIQCGTCHDAHNTHGYDGMLKISNERSRMCLTCHRL
jgi:predicted CXXCH cytochrome family protein